MKYSKLDKIKRGIADNTITKGTLILEGGGFRGLYTQGALDVLMEKGIMFENVYGVSAGTTSSFTYMSGQIGLTATLNLTYRDDPNYIGLKPLIKEHSVTGFKYLYDFLFSAIEPLDLKRFNDKARKYYAGCTNLISGEFEFFEKSECDIFKAVQASASLPYMSKPVLINDIPYLDGGCSYRIPYKQILKRESLPIMVIRTRDRSFRRKKKTNKLLNQIFYHKYPKFIKALENDYQTYNDALDMIDQDEKDHKIFVLAPSREVTISRLEKDVEKLGELYFLGYNDMNENIDKLKDYLDRV